MKSKSLIKKLLTCLICLSFVFSSVGSFVLAYSPSEWAKSDIEKLTADYIIPALLRDKDYTQPITRGEFCYLAMNAHKKLSGGNEFQFAARGFKDTYDTTICSAADIGIISGRPDGNFYPDDYITRQEIACVLGKLLEVCNLNLSIAPNTVYSILSPFFDSIEVYPWAYDSFSFCLNEGIIKGISSESLSPNSHTTREQAMVMLNRAIEVYNQKSSSFSDVNNPYNMLSCKVEGDIKFLSFSNRALTFCVPNVVGAYEYKADIFLYNGTYVRTIISPTTQFIFKNLRAGEAYKIVASAYDANAQVIKSFNGYAFPNELYDYSKKDSLIFGEGDITTKEFADANMATITVKVWRVNSRGVKYPSEATLTVHKNIADITKLAFEEIFNGEEQFPFKDVGAYSWRAPMSSGRYSHHNYGTAIDINSNENYCLYNNGTFIGSHYKPHEDIYSIPAEGEVVSIFAKYGFAWGGDAWSNPKDYMHFSYLGL